MTHNKPNGRIRRLIRAESVRWGEVVKKGGVKVE